MTKGKCVKKTGWYERTQVPARIGIYERKYGNNMILRDYWSGDKWMMPDGDEEWVLTPMDGRPWRGLARRA